jgi:ribosomal protein S18 acetylase RimI-like enzyme
MAAGSPVAILLGRMSMIRTMTREDYEGAYNLWMHTPGMGLNTMDDSKEGIARFLARNPATCFVATKDGDIVGTILTGHDGRRGYIYHLAVALSCRKQGIATALVERAIHALKEEGILKVVLVVFAKNEGGNAFWEKIGFSRREDLTYRDKSLAELERIDT